MNLNLDNQRIRHLIPHVIHEVEGETSLYDKLLPWIEAAHTRITDTMLGQNYQPQSPALCRHIEKIIVYRALADAIPSLDITLSPAGFAVINTEGRAPASKERIERLIASLNTYVDANLPHIIIELAKADTWRQTPVGQWWLSSFIPNLDDVPRHRRPGTSQLDTYRTMRDIALTLERQLAEQYLGRQFMHTLRHAYPHFTTPGTRELHDMIRTVSLRYITAHIADTAMSCPSEHEIWHLTRPILARLEYWPELKTLWQQEMGTAITSTPFRNNVRGGYYF